MKPVVYADRSSEAHDGGPDHPERPERLRACLDALEAIGVVPAASWAPASDEQLARVHDAAYLRWLEERCRQGWSRIDPDTYAAPRSFDIARRAAGACCSAVEAAFESGRTTFCLVRPPGHHASRKQAMGFCLLNHVAAGAAHALTSGECARVAIVDFDVHHGNGTEEIFWGDSRVLYVSLHQFPWYPGTGRLGDIGDGPGSGTTVNIPLPAGTTDAVYVAAMRRVVLPVLARFGPDIILASAGFDAHARDPLALMQMTSDGFGALASILTVAAGDLCSGRVVMTLEGGYDLEALPASLVATLAAMEDPVPGLPAADGEAESPPASLEALERAVAFHRTEDGPMLETGA